MAFPHGHPHYAPTTDGLYRPQTCPELNSPPTGHFLPSIRYLPTEYPLRNDPSFLPQGLSSAGNYLQLPFGFPAPGVQGISIEKSFSSRTLAGDQPWEGLKGDGANPHPSYLTDMRTTPGTNNGRTWLALHRLPSTDPHSVNNDSPSKSLPALSHPSSTTEADQTRIPSPHEGGLVFAVDDRVDSLLNDGAALATEEPSRNESPTEGQPRNPTQLVQDPSSAGLDLRTEPEGTEYSFHKLEDGLYKCTWKYESQRPCGFTSRKNSVKQHIKRVHLRLRPFLCTFCGHGFFTRYACLTHQNTHTGLKPHVCEDCGMGFPTPSARAYHRIRIHSTVCVQPGNISEEKQGL